MRVWSCKHTPYIERIGRIFFGYNFARFEKWGGARVVEWDSLENCCGLRSTEGSNPSLSAKSPAKSVGLFYSPGASIEKVVFESLPLR